MLLVIVEDYVPPAAIERAFQQAGLSDYVATLDRGQPLPTLGTLVAGGRRLVVFAEDKGGTPAWYMPAFSFIQDTPLGATRPHQLSCERYRGEPSSPLLLVNYWIPPFPPSPKLNAAIGRAPFLRRRIERCMQARGTRGAIVAVDFYQRTDVVDVARELNGGSRNTVDAAARPRWASVHRDGRGAPRARPRGTVPPRRARPSGACFSSVPHVACAIAPEDPAVARPRALP